jgi:hypothetical protein
MKNVLLKFSNNKVYFVTNEGSTFKLVSNTKDPLLATAKKGRGKPFAVILDVPLPESTTMTPVSTGLILPISNVREKEHIEAYADDGVYYAKQGIPIGILLDCTVVPSRSKNRFNVVDYKIHQHKIGFTHGKLGALITLINNVIKPRLTVNKRDDYDIIVDLMNARKSPFGRKLSKAQTKTFKKIYLRRVKEFLTPKG